ncbi:hypothetical protein D560_0732 [Bordetella holmesii ATCC 51541]|nr:hypothetical protein D560_0732 [Bordetella holmesii ATCC 51541]
MTSSRLPSLDALRGFALLGIVVVNYQVFALPYLGSGLMAPGFDRPVDWLVQGLVALFFETKFYLLFSFLFGYSFVLQIDRARIEGADPVVRLRRRCLALMVVGLLHAVLLYQGDILLAYGVFGLVLLSCRDWPARRAWRVALGLVATGSALWLAVGLLALDQPWPRDALLAQIAGIEAAAAAYRSGVQQLIAQHWRDLTGDVWRTIFYVQGPNVLAMFLAGMALCKRQALTHAPAALLRGWFGWDCLWAWQVPRFTRWALSRPGRRPGAWRGWVLDFSLRPCLRWGMARSFYWHAVNGRPFKKHSLRQAVWRCPTICCSRWWGPGCTRRGGWR